MPHAARCPRKTTIHRVPRYPISPSSIGSEGAGSGESLSGAECQEAAVPELPGVTVRQSTSQNAPVRFLLDANPSTQVSIKVNRLVGSTLPQYHIPATGHTIERRAGDALLPPRFKAPVILKSANRRTPEKVPE